MHFNHGSQTFGTGTSGAKCFIQFENNSDCLSTYTSNWTDKATPHDYDFIASREEV